MGLSIRNKHYDRFHCLVVLPIMAQEYCQMLCWIYVAKSSSICSAENQLSGLGFVACAGVVTTCLCMCAYFISDRSNQLGNIRCRRIILTLASVSWAGYL